jgi:anti-anti-sigma factor
MADVEPVAEEDADDASPPPLVIKILGEMDVSNVHRLRALLEDVTTPDPTIVIDMSELRFMDSSGLTVLLEATRRGATVYLREPSAIIRRLVDVTGLSDVLLIESAD